MSPAQTRDVVALPFVDATCPRQRRVQPAVYLPTADDDADGGGGDSAAAAAAAAAAAPTGQPTGQPTAEAADAFRQRVRQLPSRFVPRPGKPSVECVLCLHIASEIGPDYSVLTGFNPAVLAASYPHPVVGRDLSGILKVLFPMGLRYAPQREWCNRPQLGTPDCPYNYLITNNAWTSDAGLFLYAHCCIVHVVRRRETFPYALALCTRRAFTGVACRARLLLHLLHAVPGPVDAPPPPPPADCPR